MKAEKFNKRYLIKLISSGIIIILNMIVQMLLPRALSVEEYGYISYNLNIFTSIISIACLSANNAIVVKLASRNKERGLLNFYINFMMLLNVILFAATILLYSIYQELFAGQELMVVVLAMEVALLLRFQSDIVSLYDAFAIAKEQAAAQILIKIMLCITVVAGYLSGFLNIRFFYISQIAIIGSILIFLAIKLRRFQKSICNPCQDKSALCYIKEFYRFCKPLVLSQWICQLTTLFMNWTLMRWSGAVEQAMFGAAWQFNLLVAAFFEPYVALLRREFALDAGNIEKLRGIWHKSTKLMGWLITYIALFIGINGGELSYLIYGDKYRDCTNIIVLIMGYTIFQVYGQISGTFIISINKTELSAKLSLASQLILFICIYFFQIPNEIFPARLGAIGIGLTYFVSNIITVNLAIYFISQIIHIKYIKQLSNQLMPIFLCTAIIMLARNMVIMLQPMETYLSVLQNIFLELFMTTVGLFILIYIHPEFIQINRDEIKSKIRRIRNGG